MSKKMEIPSHWGDYTVADKVEAWVIWFDGRLWLKRGGRWQRYATQGDGEQHDGGGDAAVL